jgi:rubrerythrin
LSEAEKVHAISTLKGLGELAATPDNLSKMIDVKTYDYTQRYPIFVEQADRDMNPVASTILQGAGEASKSHVRLLTEAEKNIKRNKETDYWVCCICGFVDTGDMPASCKNCGAAREKCVKVK